MKRVDQKRSEWIGDMPYLRVKTGGKTAQATRWFGHNSSLSARGVVPKNPKRCGRLFGPEGVDQDFSSRSGRGRVLTSDQQSVGDDVDAPYPPSSWLTLLCHFSPGGYQTAGQISLANCQESLGLGRGRVVDIQAE